MNRRSVEKEIERINRKLRSTDPEEYLDEEYREQYETRLYNLERILSKIEDFEDDNERF